MRMVLTCEEEDEQSHERDLGFRVSVDEEAHASSQERPSHIGEGEQQKVPSPKGIDSLCNR